MTSLGDTFKDFKEFGGMERLAAPGRPRMDAPTKRLGQSTRTLIRAGRQGDHTAIDALYERYLPRLQRWAHGRVPPRARSLFSTDDVVQETFVAALGRLSTFEPHGDGAFLAYLRTTLRRKIIDMLRRLKDERDELPPDYPDDGRSPLETAITHELLDRYETALQALTERQRAAIILRIELGFTFNEIASDLDFPSSDAARMFVARALVRLTGAMNVEQ